MSFEAHPYLPQTPEELETISRFLNIQSVEDLLDGIPREFLIEKPLNIPGPLEEPEILQRLRTLSLKNWSPVDYLLFLGGGAYFHYIPQVVPAIASRPEFFTSYTPYQPEVSQGTLKMIFEFQTMVCTLTGMEVANASLYDGATALAEAVLTALRISTGRRILVPASLNPLYRKVLETYLRHRGVQLEIILFEPKTGRIAISELREHLSHDVAAVIVQSPNFFGVIEDLPLISSILKDHSAVRIACFSEAMSLGLLEPPGSFGFDIVCGEGQSLGVPVSFGGPHLGLFATRTSYLRKMPGRIAGLTRDRHGQTGFVLTLSTREQHIRREKATSNICTNEGLCALMMTVYLSLLGPEGLRKMALRNYRVAHKLRDLLKEYGFLEVFSAPYFNEFVMEHHKAATLYSQLKREGVVLGIPLSRWYPERTNQLLICATEIHDGEGIERLDRILKTLCGRS